VKYWLAARIGQRFNVNQRWLAMGIPPKRPYFKLHPELEKDIDEWALFSTVYDQILKVPIDDLFDETVKKFGKTEKDISPEDLGKISAIMMGSPHLDHVWIPLSAKLLKALEGLPPVFQMDFAGKISSICDDYMHSHIESIQEYEQMLKIFPVARGHLLSSPIITVILEDGEGKPTVDKPKGTAKVEPVATLMTTPLRSLIGRIRMLTRAHGAKAALAKKFGVTRQAVDRWIAGKSAPSAELALQLYEWARKAEAENQKKPGSVTAEPEPKTPKGIPSNESRTESPTRPESESARKPKKSST
jgi:transcriptional regulator with XRE-family HTH domain